MNDLIPLYRFFQSLRANRDFVLGLEEYFVLLEALQKDINYLETPQKLLALCRLLWLKPGQSEPFFNSLFFRSFELYSEEGSGEKDTFFDEEQSLKDDLDDFAGLDKEESEEESTFFLNILRKSSGKEIKVQSIEEIFENLKIDQFEPSSLLNRKQLSQTWRLYKKMIPKQITPNIDLEKTVQAITKNGYLKAPVFKYAEENSAELITLIDVGPTMIAFEALADTIAASAALSTKIPNKTLYFRGMPQRKPRQSKTDFALFEDKSCQSPASIAKELKSLVAKNREFSILIISDGGAAKNNFSYELIDEAVLFLKTIGRFTTKAAWLNPIPKDRWKGTSAFIIQEFVSMFEIDDHCLEPVIKIFRGKHQSNIVNINSMA